MNRSHAEKIFHQLHHCMNLMHRAHHGAHGHGHDHGHGRGEHRGQGRIMALLREKDGMSQRELADMLQIRPPSLSELLDKLESSGLTERRQHESDKRMSQVFLTPEGREMAMQIEAAREERMTHFLSGLNEAEQETFSGLLGKFLSGLKSHFGDMEEHRHGRGRCGHGHGRGQHQHGACACRHGHGEEDHEHHCCGNPGREERGSGENHLGGKDSEGHHACGCGRHGHSRGLNKSLK